jgi:K+-transporting ATPase A subunit
MSKRAMRIFAFLVVTYVIGGLGAKLYLDTPIEMPEWLRGTTMFMLRVTGVDAENNTDEAAIMATFIVSCISWTFTGFMLWLFVLAFRRPGAR